MLRPNNLLSLPKSVTWALLATVSALLGCASQLAQVPPRVDLAPYGTIALVTFTADPARASLAELATQRFAEEVLASQGGFELLELGITDTAVVQLLAAGNPSAAAQELARTRKVRAVFIGELGVTGAKPRGSIGMGGSVQVGATVSADLQVRLLSGESGGTLWRSSGAASQNVGQFSMGSGQAPTVSATDPNAAYAELVDAVVSQVTADFRPTWVKQ